MQGGNQTLAALEPELLTTAQAAKLCGLGERAFWRHAHSGAAPAPLRIGGLRVPSELLGLRWGDVDWERTIRRFLPRNAQSLGRPRLAANSGHLWRIMATRWSAPCRT